MTVHVGAVPEQPPPDQPMNLLPATATAVSVTSWPSAKLAVWVEQAGPQEMAAGDDVTVPVPVFPGALSTRSARSVAVKALVSEAELEAGKGSTTPTGVATVTTLVTAPEPEPAIIVALTV